MLYVYIVATGQVRALKRNMAQHMQERELGWIVGHIKNGRIC
jgi:hypothetical protein